MRSRKNQQKLQLFLLLKEVIMITLVVISFVFLGLEYFGKLTHQQLLAVDAYEIIVAFIFVGEFVFELYHAVDRRKYFHHHWFYLLAAIPIPTETFDLLRGIRLLRVLKFLKVFTEARYEKNTKLFN